jgi:hypothetical protein
MLRCPRPLGPVDRGEREGLRAEGPYLVEEGRGILFRPFFLRAFIWLFSRAPFVKLIAPPPSYGTVLRGSRYSR